MSATRLAILGAGSVRCSVAVIASLATYFGERPLEIQMYDSDMERLDLFDRFARVCFLMTKNGHSLISTTDASEALVDSTKVVLMVGENCARRYLKEQHRMGIADLGAEAMIEQAVDEMHGSVPADADLLSLLPAGIAIPRSFYYRADWPAAPMPAERLSVPHQVLRWIRGEEYTHELFREHERSPLKLWLDDVNSLEQVVRGENRGS